jgi:SAM-dependent methyltransferase
MKKIDNHKFYLESYKKYKSSAKGARWSSKENQYIRFKYLIDFIKEDIENSSLLDLGCGYGHLIHYFQENHIYPKSYTGLDCETFMIENSLKQFPNSIFLQKNFLVDQLPRRDYYICSGALNTLQRHEVLKTIELCFLNSNKGLVFNFLVKSFIHNLNFFDIYIHCKKLTENIRIEGDYIENDYTFFLEK